MFKKENMIMWVLLWAVLAIPFFAYEGTIMQYNLIKQFGCDPVTLFIAGITFIPFFGYIFSRD